MVKFSLMTILIAASIYSGAAQADLRSNARNSLSELRKTTAPTRFPDEVRSLDATLATAEMYFQLGDQKNAERYYQLANQKANLIKQQLAQPGDLEPSETQHAPPSAVPSKQATPPSIDDKPAQSKPTPPTAPIAATLKALSQQSAAEALEAEPAFSSEQLIGTSGTYTVTKAETLRLVAAKLGVNRYQLAAANNLKVGDQLKIGQVLRYNNQRIIPDKRMRDGIVINIPDRMLYLFQNGNLQYSTAVALGTPTKTEQFVWETPVGKFKIVNKAKDPVWTVPPSIQEEMRLEGKEVITSIPAGKDNPLGKYAMKTSLPGILIHSTTKPWSIYTYASHGCIRVFPERMEELFNLVKTNTAGEIIYKPVKLTETADGRILLEAHGDIYNKTKGLAAEAKSLIRAKKLENRVNWEKVKRVLSRKSGVAEDVSHAPHASQQTAENNDSQSPS